MEIFPYFLNSSREAVTVVVNGHNKGPEWVRIFKMDKIWLPIDPRARLHINANIFMASLSLSMNFNSSGHLNFQGELGDQVTMNTANSWSELSNVLAWSSGDV